MSIVIEEVNKDRFDDSYLEKSCGQIVGDDIDIQPLIEGSQTVQSCALACANKDNCTHFTYDRSDNTCQSLGRTPYVNQPCGPDNQDITIDNKSLDVHTVYPSSNKLPEISSSFDPCKNSPKKDGCLCSNDNDCGSSSMQCDDKGRCRSFPALDNDLSQWRKCRQNCIGVDRCTGFTVGFDGSCIRYFDKDHLNYSNFVDDENFNDVVAYQDKQHGPRYINFDTRNTSTACEKSFWSGHLKSLAHRSLQECNGECIMNKDCKSYSSGTNGTCWLSTNKCDPMNTTFKDWGLYTKYAEGQTVLEAKKIYGSKVSNQSSLMCRKVKDRKLLKRHDGDSANIFLSWNDSDPLPPTIVTMRDTKRAKNHMKKGVYTFDQCQKLCKEDRECKSFASFTNGGCQTYSTDCTGDVVFDPDSDNNTHDFFLDLQPDERENVLNANMCTKRKKCDDRVFWNKQFYDCNPSNIKDIFGKSPCSNNLNNVDRYKDDNVALCECNLQTRYGYGEYGEDNAQLVGCNNNTAGEWLNQIHFSPCKWGKPTTREIQPNSEISTLANLF